MDFELPISQFQVKSGQTVDLEEIPTNIDPLSKNKAHYAELLEQFRNEISDLQSVLYAHDRYALLLIFQGMDTAGKGGAIKHVMSGVNPQGCQVFNFGPPSSEELDHDYLWRTNKRLPERGRIGIFDRSYYEEVLVVRVHPEVLEKQRVPDEFKGRPTIWAERFEDINNMESFQYRNGTRIIKFFLHISREEQRKRLIERIDNPHKNWKFSMFDLRSRERWDDYQQAFAECLSKTSTEFAPWYIVPGDDKRNARLIVSQIVLENMQQLKMDFPVATDEHLEELRKAKKLLKAD